jgi:glucose/arabinose dehydrogenase
MHGRRAFAGPLVTALLALAACAAPTGNTATTPGTSTPVPTESATPTRSTTPTTSSAATASAEVTSFTARAPWPRLTFVKRLTGLDQPIFLTWASGDPGRLFIAEKGGVVRTAHGGKLDSGTFLDLSGKVSGGGEQGLLSIAFPPGAASKQRVYACYTEQSGDVIVSRFRVSGGAAVAGSEQVVLRVPHRAYPNHNGGDITFGPDGMLYVGTGDGGSEGDPNDNGQNLGVLASKLLRIDVEGVTSGGALPNSYLVPATNPFLQRSGARPETWAWGLRNPWRYSFDAATGDLYIGDVGQDRWEEIDFQPASSRGGVNYGWSIMEGSHRYKSGSTAGLTPPVAEYGHDLGDAVVGGYVYRGATSPALRGVYLYGDNGSGRIWGMRRESGQWRTRELAHPGYKVSSFGEDGSRELYVLDLAAGVAYEVTAR